MDERPDSNSSEDLPSSYVKATASKNFIIQTRIRPTAKSQKIFLQIKITMCIMSIFFTPGKLSTCLLQMRERSFINSSLAIFNFTFYNISRKECLRMKVSVKEVRQKLQPCVHKALQYCHSRWISEMSLLAGGCSDQIRKPLRQSPCCSQCFTVPKLKK